MTAKLYKAAEVCEMAGLQPYVLRSWEREFPGIGVQKSPDSARFYRQADVDQVLRIKQLVLGEGLTLAGARRRLEDAGPSAERTSGAELAEVLETLGADARARIAHVRSGLRSILDVLSTSPGVPAASRRERPSAPEDGAPSARAERSPERPEKRAMSARGKSSAAATRTAPAKRGAVARKGAAGNAGGGKRKRVTQRF